MRGIVSNPGGFPWVFHGFSMGWITVWMCSRAWVPVGSIHADKQLRLLKWKLISNWFLTKKRSFWVQQSLDNQPLGGHEMTVWWHDLNETQRKLRKFRDIKTIAHWQKKLPLLFWGLQSWHARVSLKLPPVFSLMTDVYGVRSCTEWKSCLMVFCNIQFFFSGKLSSF